MSPSPSTVDFAKQYEILTNGYGAVRARREVVRASGADVVSYLQGQLSQDIEKLAVGDTSLSWVLQPHGKVDALVRITHTADTEFILDTDNGFSGLLLERLNRFKLNTKVDFELLPWKVLSIRGTQAKKPEADLVIAVNWGSITGWDAFGENLEIPEGATECSFELYESMRIEMGVPRMGSELDQLTIPNEAGINDRTISFTKGCYTGQELVARIDSRGGNVPRHLRVLVIDSEEAPPSGSQIVAPNGPATIKPYGVITSSAYSPRLGKSVALAFIRRDIQVGATATVEWDAGPSTAVVEKAPLEA